MQQTDNAKKPHNLSARIRKPSWPVLAGAVILIVIFVSIGVTWTGEKNSRSDVYKDISGAAGLQASITYDVQCDKKPCDKKPAFDFNVYIFTENGQQVNVVRPDKDGKVNLALPEGDYVMLIGKQFGKHRQFPQEPLHLKNGKLLELKLHY